MTDKEQFALVFLGVLAALWLWLYVDYLRNGSLYEAPEPGSPENEVR